MSATSWFSSSNEINRIPARRTSSPEVSQKCSLRPIEDGQPSTVHLNQKNSPITAPTLVILVVSFVGAVWISQNSEMFPFLISLNPLFIQRVDVVLWALNFVLVGSVLCFALQIWLDCPLKVHDWSANSSIVVLVLAAIELFGSFINSLLFPNHALYILISVKFFLFVMHCRAANNVEQLGLGPAVPPPNMPTFVVPIICFALCASFTLRTFAELATFKIEGIEAGVYFFLSNMLSVDFVADNMFLYWAVIPQIIRIILFGSSARALECFCVRLLDVTTWALATSACMAFLLSFRQSLSNSQQHRVSNLQKTVTELSNLLHSNPRPHQAPSDRPPDSSTASIVESFNKELRTVLHSVVNCVALISPSGDQLSTNQARHREYLRNLDTSIQILHALVSNTITLLKTQAGGIILDRTSVFRVDDVFDRIIDRCRPVEYKEGIDIICSIDADVPPLFVGDHYWLEEILSHLFDNAVRFTQKGEVRLSARVVERLGSQVRLALSVEDTGPGIDPSLLATITMPFKHGAADRGRGDIFSDDIAVESPAVPEVGIREGIAVHGTSGSGLGIPIAYQLARLFDSGDLQIASEPNVGTVCTFTAVFSSQRHGSLPTIPKSDVRSLCICGPALQAESLPTLLARKGVWNVVSTDNMQDSVKLLQNSDQPFEFVLIYDWTSEYRGSFKRLQAMQVANLIRGLAIKSQPKICIVAATADTKTSRPANIDALIPKPIRLRTLRQTIARLFSDETDDTRPLRLVDRSANGVFKLDSRSSSFGNDTSLSSDAITVDDYKNVKLRVLVAEDNNVNARVISASVKKEGHECVVTSDGKSCVLEFCKDAGQRYDLVFMDLYMPGMNGIEATVQIREYENRCGKTPTIIVGVTAEDRPQEQHQMLNAGMDDIILKPVTVSGMRSFLLLAQKRKFIGSTRFPPKLSSADSFASKWTVNDDGSSGSSVSGTPRSSVSSSSDETQLSSLKDKVILVAEDNDFTAKMTLQVLRANGWLCERAKNGRDAFEMITSTYDRYSIILMDIQMPLMDGLTCTRLIREWEQLHSIHPGLKILALTSASEDTKHRNECKAAGCNDFLMKPVSYPKLIPYLTQLHESS